ncbi:hypothetical protein COZ14_00405 [Candidatus Dojkabacteria bacterium CG_4_10_14_3_um_filter_Dojkabacteria_WS6_41_9]|nr:MAG: hypothetical protein COZ14_00405 [Candidatus Dojkabacteria bacterium CG_4_10_14_3_um_filter_Dojkabacteria_WS6_41_9]
MHGKAQVYDPYRWMPEIGIQLDLQREVSPLPNSFLGDTHLKFSDVASSGVPVPVSLKIRYVKGLPKKSIVAVYQHYVDWKQGKKGTIPPRLKMWEVNKIQTYAELTQQQQLDFVSRWKQESVKDLKSILKLDDLAGKEGQELLDGLVLGVENQSYVCVQEENSTTRCWASTKGNVAEASTYLVYTLAKDYPIAQRIRAEMHRRLVPFAAEDSTLPYTCGDKGPRDDCERWSYFQSYQAPLCPIRDIKEGATNLNVAFYLRATSNYRPLKFDKANLIKKYQQYQKNTADSNLRTELQGDLEFACRALLRAETIEPEDFELLEQIYYSIGFRNISIWTTEGQDLRPTSENLAKLVYDSYMFAPYKFHFLQDSELLRRSQQYGYGQNKIEEVAGYAYNLIATWVAVYVIE